jgi:hypothetical protein
MWYNKSKKNMIMYLRNSSIHILLFLSVHFLSLAQEKAQPISAENMDNRGLFAGVAVGSPGPANILLGYRLSSISVKSHIIISQNGFEGFSFGIPVFIFQDQNWHFSINPSYSQLMTKRETISGSTAISVATGGYSIVSLPLEVSFYGLYLEAGPGYKIHPDGSYHTKVDEVVPLISIGYVYTFGD